MPAPAAPDTALPLIVAITGASGAIYGMRILELLRGQNQPVHLVISPTGEQTLRQETDFALEQIRALAAVHYDYTDLSAAIASGSYPTRGMIVAPCSIKTLSGIANSYTDNLIVRAADVCLKEGRPLLLAVRETPLHLGHLKLMEQAAAAGAVIFPPVPSFYHRPTSLDQIVTETAARILARIGIVTPALHSWTGPE
jgi:4-hydroxy-3-polyprenylbenzoate decarboxylase